MALEIENLVHTLLYGELHNMSELAKMTEVGWMVPLFKEEDQC